VSAGAEPDRLPTYEDVVAAAARIAGHAHRTPVLRSRLADELLGAEVVFKCESFQRSGAFKFRGAYSALSRFTEAQRKAGVVAFSSGNHAQAIALSAQLLRTTRRRSSWPRPAATAPRS
jgi:threonine dehydratase